MAATQARSVSGGHLSLACNAGRTPVDAVKAGGEALGCRKMASDADWRDLNSHAFHAAIEFSETECVAFLRQPID